MSLEEILNTHQYRIKLGLKAYLCSGINIITFIVCFFVFEGLVSFLVSYLVFSMFFYKFFFGLTRNGDQYSPFFIKQIGAFFKKMRFKSKHIENL